jgi:ABC-type nitrate/sulfonate/bicarbonate transport system substrate-binding protein
MREDDYFRKGGIILKWIFEVAWEKCMDSAGSG